MQKQPVVLLVTHDAPNRLAVAQNLRTYGYEVLAAASGEEGARILRANARIGVLITEIELEREPDGLALAKLARELNPKVEVIYTSPAPHRIPAAQKVGGAPMIRSPYRPAQMVGVISELQGRGGTAPHAA